MGARPSSPLRSLGSGGPTIKFANYIGATYTASCNVRPVAQPRTRLSVYQAGVKVQEFDNLKPLAQLTDTVLWGPDVAYEAVVTWTADVPGGGGSSTGGSSTGGSSTGPQLVVGAATLILPAFPSAATQAVLARVVYPPFGPMQARFSVATPSPGSTVPAVLELEGFGAWGVQAFATQCTGTPPAYTGFLPLKLWSNQDGLVVTVSQPSAPLPTWWDTTTYTGATQATPPYGPWTYAFQPPSYSGAFNFAQMPGATLTLALSPTAATTLAVATTPGTPVVASSAILSPDGGGGGGAIVAVYPSSFPDGDGNTVDGASVVVTPMTPARVVTATLDIKAYFQGPGPGVYTSDVRQAGGPVMTVTYPSFAATLSRSGPLGGAPLNTCASPVAAAAMGVDYGATSTYTLEVTVTGWDGNGGKPAVCTATFQAQQSFEQDVVDSTGRKWVHLSVVVDGVGAPNTVVMTLGALGPLDAQGPGDLANIRGLYPDASDPTVLCVPGAPFTMTMMPALLPTGNTAAMPCYTSVTTFAQYSYEYTSGVTNWMLEPDFTLDGQRGGNRGWCNVWDNPAPVCGAALGVGVVFASDSAKILPSSLFTLQAAPDGSGLLAYSFLRGYYGLTACDSGALMPGLQMFQEVGTTPSPGLRWGIARLGGGSPQGVVLFCGNPAETGGVVLPCVLHDDYPGMVWGVYQGNPAVAATTNTAVTLDRFWLPYGPLIATPTPAPSDASLKRCKPPLPHPAKLYENCINLLPEFVPFRMGRWAPCPLRGAPSAWQRSIRQACRACARSRRTPPPPPPGAC